MKIGKRIVSVILVALMMITIVPFSAFAERSIIDSGACGADGDNLTWVLYDDGELVISGQGNMEDWTYYGAPWYYSNHSKIKKVTIENGITSIGDYAFNYCYSLTSVTIGNSVTSIGKSAFVYCDHLASVTIGNSVTSIGNYAFAYCSSLASVTIPDSVINIGDCSFEYCGGLASVTIGNSVTRIGNYAFFYCDRLASITIGNSVTSIGDWAFYYCYSLASVTIPDSVTSIGDWAFSNCGSLTHITIPNSVINIGDSAFRACNSLESITISNSVTSIGEAAFYDCGSLTSIAIPDSVTNIGVSVFYGCTSLTDVYYGGSESEWNLIEIGSGNDELKSATIHFNSTGSDYSQDGSGIHTPSGYDFYTDSYQFENYGSSISKKYFTTMYEEEQGKLLYKKKKNVSNDGHCFGMAYTTAAIYNGLPDCSRISTLDRGLFNYKFCDNIREIVNFDFDFPFQDVSSTFSIGENTITINDYIKYAFIYQWSSNVLSQKEATWNDINGLFNTVKNSVSNDKIEIIVLIYHYKYNEKNKIWENDAGHAVLAVGIDGNDILIDDPNNSGGLEHISIDGDTWEYSNPFKSDGVNSTNSIICYSTDYMQPYYTLATGKRTSVASGIISNASNIAQKETYIEDMEKLENDKLLMYVNCDTYNIDSENTIYIAEDIGDNSDSIDESEYPGDLYWISEDKSITVSNVAGDDNEFILAGKDISIGVNTNDDSVVTMTVNEGVEVSAEIDTTKGNEYSVYFETTDENENDIITTVTGKASGDTVTATETDTGVKIEGLNDITVTLETAEGSFESTIEVKDGSEVNIIVKEDENTITTDFHTHTVGDWEVVTPAEVGKEGLEQQKCTVCGTVLNKRSIPALEDTLFMLGDLNDDGKITASDARLALRISAKLENATDKQSKAADVNFDNKITAADARMILRVSAKLDSF